MIKRQINYGPPLSGDQLAQISDALNGIGLVVVDPDSDQAFIKDMVDDVIYDFIDDLVADGFMGDDFAIGWDAGKDW